MCLCLHLTWLYGFRCCCYHCWYCHSQRNSILASLYCANVFHNVCFFHRCLLLLLFFGQIYSCHFVWVVAMLPLFFSRCCCSSSCMNVQSTLILLLLICCCLERFIDGFISCSLDFRWLPFFSFASWCYLVLCDFFSPFTTNSLHFEREISEIRRMRRHFRQSNPIFDRIQPI